MGGIGSIWLRIGTGGGLMWTRWWTSGFHNMLGSSRAAAQLAASQEGLSSMSEWVSERYSILAACILPCISWIKNDRTSKIESVFLINFSNINILPRFRGVTIDGVWIGEWFIDHLYTHDSWLQVITAPPLISTAPVPDWSVFIINSEDSSASHVQAHLSQLPVQNSCSLGHPNCLQDTPRHEPRRKHRSFLYASRFRGSMFMSPSNGVA
jgi:hypothetical protein